MSIPVKFMCEPGHVCESHLKLRVLYVQTGIHALKFQFLGVL